MRTDLLSVILTTEWQGSAAILIVLAICAVLRRTALPRRLNCLLWLVVLVRLLWAGGITIELPAKTTPPIAAAAVRAAEWTAVPVGVAAAPVGTQETSAFPLREVVLAVWCLGMAIMAGYTLVSCAVLQRRLSGAFCYKPENCMVSENIESAFVWGLFCPRICLPAGLSAKRRALMILHEQTHIRRGDHWRKALFWLAVCLHWWNPLVWLAFKQMSRDMEVACDEAVLTRLNDTGRADYCQSLLDIAKNRVPSCPPAFDGSDVRERVCRILAWKRPARRATMAALAFCLVMGSVMLVHPVAEKPDAGVYPTEPVVETVGPEKTAESGLFQETAPTAAPEQAEAHPQEYFAEEAEQPEPVSGELPPVELPGETAAPEQPVFMTESEPAMEIGEAEAIEEEAIVVCTEASENGFIWPVPASTYVSRWMNDSHRGTDIAAERGAEVLAMAEGEVEIAGYHWSYGNYITIAHTINGVNYRTLYAHCDSLLVNPGDHVIQGQIIATVGNSGDATGNCCHVELTREGARFSLHDLFPSM